jgi:hypothetical protein
MPPLAAQPSATWKHQQKQQDGELEDAVLIGSAAPSFSLPRLQQAAHGTAASPGGAAPQPEAASAPSPLPRRSSYLAAQLNTQDLSLAALAAASQQGTRCTSSAGAGSLQHCSSRNSSTGTIAAASHSWEQEKELEAAETYASDEEAETPDVGDLGTTATALHRCQQQQRQRLSSGDLAVLRASLLELDLLAPQRGSGGSPAAAAPAVSLPFKSDWDAEIPDRVVLQELGSRLGRLDSQKRRVLLAVLAKNDDMADGTAGAAGDAGGAAGDEESGAATARLLIAESLGSSLADRQAGGCNVTEAAPLALPVPAVESSEAAGPVATQQQPDMAPAAASSRVQSPSKGLIGKLAALRLGRIANGAAMPIGHALAGSSNSSSGSSSQKQQVPVQLPGLMASAQPASLESSAAVPGKQPPPQKQQQRRRRHPGGATPGEGSTQLLQCMAQ